ncbi:MAG: NADP-dependent phosphogluconate dehydrogenase, partial [Planctomycetota bacterium]
MTASNAQSTDGTCDVAVLGMGVMGRCIALNMADHGRTVAIYNRSPAPLDDVLAENPPESFEGVGAGLVGCRSFADVARALKRPRAALVLVPAGGPTDAVLDGLAEVFDDGDVLVDGGNANWRDTVRRNESIRAKGLHFVGCGVSGGEEGARFGPSLMPGGEREAYEVIKPTWEAIAAKVDPKTGKPIEGAKPRQPINAPGAEPCCAYVGPDGAGHFVKMVHNGIEYADMQLIAEAYALLRHGAGFETDRIADVFATWNQGPLDSYLIEITAEVLRQQDPRTGRPFVDVVLDRAGQKGTGRWTSVESLEFGVPAPTIAEAVFARAVSAIKDERVRASTILPGPSGAFDGDADALVADLGKAML